MHPLLEIASWTESSPGILSKELDGEEKIFRAISTAFQSQGKEQWCLHCVCSFRFGPSYTGEPPEVALREAWKALRFEFPGLSMVPNGFTKVYVQPDARVVEDWASQTFFVESTGSADELVANFAPRDLPSLHYFPSSSEILFRSSHWRIDGIGTCMLLDRFFSILAQPQDLELVPWANELQNISPSMEDAVGPAETPTPAMEELARNVIDNFRKNTLNSYGLPYKGDVTTSPAGSSRQAIVFTKDSTNALVLACKKRSFTVTAAVHAALAEAVFALSLDQQRDFTTVTSISLRKYLQPPFRTKAHACQTYVASVTPRVLRNSNFSSRAAVLAQDYKKWHSDAYMKSLRLIYKYQSDAILASKPPPTPPCGVFVSSLGIIEQYLDGDYGDAVHVDNFRFGVSMMTRQMMFYVWTFRGQLNLSVNYNDAYYDAHTAQNLLVHVQTVLETELGLKHEHTNP